MNPWLIVLCAIGFYALVVVTIHLMTRLPEDVRELTDDECRQIVKGVMAEDDFDDYGF